MAHVPPQIDEDLELVPSAIVALRRVSNRSVLPDHATAAVDSVIELLEQYAPPRALRVLAFGQSEARRAAVRG